MDRSLLKLPRLIGHRGSARHAPENTLAGLRMAAAQGLLMVEVDVMLTRDGVPILMHDETLDRTTSGRGRIEDLDYADIQGLDAGRWFGPAFAGERIPTLVDALDLILHLNLLLNLEIKPTAGRGEDTASIALTTAMALWPEDRQPPLISSFDAAALDVAVKLAPAWPRGYLIDHRPDDWAAQAERFAATTIHVNGRHETAESIAAFRASGRPVLAYTVNDPAAARELFGWGVRAVFTDDPPAVAPALRG
jgi:glycerophosphoryl diester phosphodiesterase